MKKRILSIILSTCMAFVLTLAVSAAIDTSTIYINAAWAGKTEGETIETGKVFGTNAFASMIDFTAADDTENLVIYGGNYENGTDEDTVDETKTLFKKNIRHISTTNGTVYINTGNLLFITETPGTYTVSGDFETTGTPLYWQGTHINGVTRFSGSEDVTFNLTDASFVASDGVHFYDCTATMDADSSITLNRNKWGQLNIYNSDVTCYGTLELELDVSNGSLLNVGTASEPSILTLSGDDASLSLSMDDQYAVYDAKVNAGSQIVLAEGASFENDGKVILEASGNNVGQIITDMESSVDLTGATISGAGQITIDANNIQTGASSPVTANLTGFGGTVQILNAPMDAEIDSTTGELILTPMTEENLVAKVGKPGSEVYCEDFVTALNEVKSGDTITLLRNVAIDTTLTVNIEGEVTIDGKGHEITPAETFMPNGENAALVISKQDSIYTIKNLTFSGFSDLIRVVRANFCTAAIENCIFENNDVTEGVITSAYATLRVEGCKFNGNTAGVAVINVGFDVGDDGTDRVAYITGNTFTENSAGTAGIYLTSSADVTGNYFSGNIHTGGNTNGSAILAGPYEGDNINYSIKINGNAFENAMASSDGTDLPAVFVEDWSDLGSDTEFDLNNNYWNGGAPNYGSTGNPVVDLDTYHTNCSYEDGVLTLWSTDEPDFNFDHFYWTVKMLYSQQFDVTASAAEGGTITPAGISKVKYDKNITYTITPDEGYAIADVLVNGESVGAVSEYTIKRIKKDQTIHAIFVKTAWENPYTDVSDEAWYYEDVEFVSENGLMIGTGDNKFSPSAIVNRAMLVTVLWRLEGSPVVDNPVDFYDVPTDESYTAAVNWAAANGIVNGYGDGIFGAMNDLTHEQIMAILNRYAVYKKWSENVSGNVDDSYTNSEWAENNVLWADFYGMFDGIGSDISDLTESADRAELAAYLRRFCERFMAE